MENRSNRRKPLGADRAENREQTQPTYDAGSGNRIQAVFVLDDRSHHCAIPAPQMNGAYAPPLTRWFSADQNIERGEIRKLGGGGWRRKCGIDLV